MFQRSVRPRIETEDLEVLSIASEHEEAMSTSGDEDGGSNDGTESEAEPKNRDEDVRLCRRFLLSYHSN